MEQLENGVNNCGGIIQNLTVAADQIGAHAHFDIGAISDVDFSIVWETNKTYNNGTKIWGYATVDGNGDNFPGIFIVDPLFSGVTVNINLTIVEPDIFISIDIPDGLNQECDSYGGNNRTVTLNAVLPSDDTLKTVTWTLNGEPAGNNLSQQAIFFPLGEYKLQVDVTTVNGVTASESKTVKVTDRTGPSLSADMVPVNNGDRKHKLVIDVQDTCDPAPIVYSNVGVDINEGSEVNIKGTKGSVWFQTQEVVLSVSARDASNNGAIVYRYYPVE